MGKGMNNVFELSNAISKAADLAGTIDGIARDNPQGQWDTLHNQALDIVKELQRRLANVEQSISNNMNSK